MPLREYIEKNYVSQAEFARANGFLPQQVTKWLRNEWIIVGGMLYAPQREAS